MIVEVNQNGFVLTEKRKRRKKGQVKFVTSVDICRTCSRRKMSFFSSIRSIVKRSEGPSNLCNDRLMKNLLYWFLFSTIRFVTMKTFFFPRLFSSLLSDYTYVRVGCRLIYLFVWLIDAQSNERTTVISFQFVLLNEQNDRLIANGDFNDFNHQLCVWQHFSLFLFLSFSLFFSLLVEFFSQSFFFFLEFDSS